MDVLHLTGKLLKGALIGGIVALMGGILVLAVIGLIYYGPGGVLLGLYFIYLPIYYAAPVGMLVGAVIGVIRALRRSGVRTGVFSGAWVGLLLLGFAVLMVIPHRLMGETRMIMHGARWTIDDSASAQCSVPVITLYLVEYTHYEKVCSALLYTALASERREIIPITYKVLYNFGESAGYELNGVGSVAINSYPDWLLGGDTCGREPLPPCDNPPAWDERMLHESSWVE